MILEVWRAKKLTIPYIFYHFGSLGSQKAYNSLHILNFWRIQKIYLLMMWDALNKGPDASRLKFRGVGKLTGSSLRRGLCGDFGSQTWRTLRFWRSGEPKSLQFLTYFKTLEVWRAKKLTIPCVF